MSLCQRVLLVSVIAVLWSFLPATIGSPASRVGVEEAELVGLLKRLQNVLEKDADEDEEDDGISMLQDNVNEQHNWGEDLLRIKASSQRKHFRLTVPSTELSASQQQALVDAMNAKRRQEGAANMYQLRWNSKLADLAQYWSDKCVFNHGSGEFEMDEIGFATVGQTIAASTDPFSPSKVVNTWYSLKRNYDARADTCNMGQACGAYKQLVSGYTTDVGCGLTTCSSIADSANGVPLSNAFYVVCYWGPPGSYQSEPTLIPGPACTRCKQGQFYCNDGLCNSQCSSEGPGCSCAASCKNCATQTSDCRCTCNRGSTGVDCGNACADNPLQKCGKGGWQLSHCQLFDFVRQTHCPKFCGYCVDGTPCA